MSRLLRVLHLLCCAALLFLLHYVWLRPPTEFVATGNDDPFQTQGEGITWQRYRDAQVVQQVEARRATVFFATAPQGGVLPVLGAVPTRVELHGEVRFAHDGHALRTTRATFAEGVVSSTAAVQITGGGLYVRGHEGFSYTLADGQLTLRGKIEGEAYPADRTHR